MDFHTLCVVVAQSPMFSLRVMLDPCWYKHLLCVNVANMLAEVGHNFNFILRQGLSEREVYQFLSQSGLDDETGDLTRRLFQAYQMDLLSSVFICCKLVTSSKELYDVQLVSLLSANKRWSHL